MRNKKTFFRVESKNPQDEIWFQKHEWKVKTDVVYAPAGSEKPMSNVIILECAYCKSELLCLGFMQETEQDEKTYIFNVENQELTCEELCVREIIE